MFNNLFLKNNAICEMWKKYYRARQATDGHIIWCFACWVPKATNTHSQYAILIVFPLQQWLHERALKLRYTYIACLVYLRIDERSKARMK